MPDLPPLLTLATAIVVLNVPFGYWRAGTARFSRPWFIAVHFPVPFVIALRVSWGIAWRVGNLPMLLGAYFLGQMVGGQMRVWRDRRRPR
jgi:hypothetical protein